MADREAPTKIERARGTIVVDFRGGDAIGSIPPFTQAPPLVPDPGDLGRLTPAAVRTISVNATNGIVPVVFGGPINCGGYLICTPKVQNGYAYIDMALGEGPIQSAGTLKCDDKTFTELGIISEIHLGVAGDTTSTIMTEAFPGYTIPEYIAHVAYKAPIPNQTTGNYDPLRFRAEGVLGVLLYDTRTAVTAHTTNPALLAYGAITNARWGVGDLASNIEISDFNQMANDCDTDIDPGAGTIKRWEVSGRLDEQMHVDEFLNALRTHMGAYFQYVGGKWIGFCDLLRSDSGIVFADEGTSANLSTLVHKETRGYDEKPTVVTVDYTDVANDQDGSVQIPDPLAGGTEWVEKRYAARWITTPERARRLGTYLYNRMNTDVDLTARSWMTGLRVLPGTRCRLKSRRAIKSTVAPPNAGGIAGHEDATVVSARAQGSGWNLQWTLYRESVFSDTIVTGGNPTPPAVPDPYAIPDDPTGVVAPFATESDYGIIKFAPAQSPFVKEYVVEDMYGDPAEPAILETVPKEMALNSEGKYVVFAPTAVHGTPATGRTLKVRVRSVTYKARRSPGVTATWTVGSVLQPRTSQRVYGKVDQLFNAEDTWAFCRSTPNPAGPPFFVVVSNDCQVQHARSDGSGDNTFWLRRSLLEFITNESTIICQDGVVGLPPDKTITGLILGLYKAGAATLTQVHVVPTPTAGDLPADSTDWSRFSFVTKGNFNPSIISGNGYFGTDVNTDQLNLLGKTRIGLITNNDLTDSPPANLTNQIFSADGTSLASPGPYLIVKYTSAIEDARSSAGAGGVALQATPPTVQQIGSAWVQQFWADEFRGKTFEPWIQCTPEVDGVTTAFTIPGGTYASGGIVNRGRTPQIPGIDYTRSGTSPTINFLYTPEAGRGHIYFTGNRLGP